MPDRKSWVSVIVPPHNLQELMLDLSEALLRLHESIGSHEFHFTDVFNRRGDYKDVDLEDRLVLFEEMSEIVCRSDAVIIVQTFDSETLAHLRSQTADWLPARIPLFDFSKQEDAALFFLLLRVKRYMQRTPTHPDVKARVLVDEGFKRAGIAIEIPGFEDTFADSSVYFASSHSLYLLQLADFAAFCLNRSQLALGRGHRKPIDRELLRIMAPLVSRFANLEQKEVNPDDDGPLISLEETRPHGPGSA